MGLLEAQRGRDAAAVAALRQAEAEPHGRRSARRITWARPSSWSASPTPAAEAFERALARNPSRNDLLEIFQALGRIHQRAHRNDQALAVWTRLEALFPDDARVQEQIASALAEEAQLEPALARYEALARSSRDPYRRVQFRLEAADLKVRLGRQAEALRDFEALLGGLDPESWLAREVRRRVEDVFLRNDDQAGLAAYYERWLKTAPEDVEAMARLGRTLADQGRAAEARTLARPGGQARPVAEGAAAGPDRAARARAEVRRGRRAVRGDQPEPTRTTPTSSATGAGCCSGTPRGPRPSGSRPPRRSGGGCSRRRPRRPGDRGAGGRPVPPGRASATRRSLCTRRRSRWRPTRRSIASTSANTYHSLKRPDDALAAWRAIAAGPNRNARSLTRLGEVLAGFGYKDEAIAAVERSQRSSTPIRSTSG